MIADTLTQMLLYIMCSPGRRPDPNANPTLLLNANPDFHPNLSLILIDGNHNLHPNRLRSASPGPSPSPHTPVTLALAVTQA